MSILPEQIELISVLNAHSVEYLGMGGHVVMEYSEPRATKDVDIFIRNDAQNAQRVFRALAAFGAPLAGFGLADFQDGSVPLRHAAHRIDTCSNSTGLILRQPGSTVHTFVGD